MKTPLKFLFLIGGVILILYSVFIYVEPQAVFAYESADKDFGFEITPRNQPLFHVENMQPGEVYSSNFSLKNTNELPLDVLFDMQEIKSSGKADLFKQMEIAIHQNGNHLYEGTMKDFKEKQLGLIPQKGKSQLDITIQLPGPSTGNEFQDAALETQFSFLGTLVGNGQEDPNEPEGSLPQTGGISPTIFYAMGSILLVGGLVLKRKTS